jgi:hypothetical protein
VVDKKRPEFLEAVQGERKVQIENGSEPELRISELPAGASRVTPRCKLLALALLVFALGGCSIHRQEFTAEEQAIAGVPGMSAVRVWADVPPTAIPTQPQRVQSSASYKAGAGTFPIRVLSISGGAENGAFGAGVLVGWSEAGDRPEFAVVSGVSTGALIAPFAFLGPKYDAELTAVYTQISARDVFRRRSPLASLLGTSVVDTSPLKRLIADFVTPKLLQEIAAENRKGRRLLVVTTNLDAQRPVVWDMGAIARQGDHAALELFRKVLLASASIPGLFPPVMIEVEAEGRRFREMHVDGGTTLQMFTLPDAVLLGSLRNRDVLDRLEFYVLFNNPLAPDFEVVEPRTFAIISRSISTLTRVNGRNNLLGIHSFARRRGIPLHLTYIGTDFDIAYEDPFDPSYMRPLFNYGYERGRRGLAWSQPGNDMLERLTVLASH